MLSLLDIAERTQKGPKVEGNAWNMGLFRKMNELTERYQLYYPEDNPSFENPSAFEESNEIRGAGDQESVVFWLFVRSVG